MVVVSEVVLVWSDRARDRFVMAPETAVHALISTLF